MDYIYITLRILTAIMAGLWIGEHLHTHTQCLVALFSSLVLVAGLYLSQREAEKKFKESLQRIIKDIDEL